MIEAIEVMLAFAFGLAAARTSLCCVAAVMAAIQDRNPTGLLVLAILVVTSASLLLAAAVVDPIAHHLPAAFGLSTRLLSGAVLLAIGSLVNGACYLGTALYVGRGRLDFIGTLVGIVAAQATAWMPWGAVAAPSLRRGSDLPLMGWPVLVLATATVVALAGIGLRGREAARRAAVRGAFAVGLVAGLLEVVHPGWSASAALGGTGLAASSALAFFAGGLAGARLQHTFAPRGFTGRGMARCLGGGWLMGTGALWIPGGNDVLLTWAAPGVALYGVAALLLYLLTLALAISMRSLR